MKSKPNKANQAKVCVTAIVCCLAACIVNTFAGMNALAGIFGTLSVWVLNDLPTAVSHDRLARAINQYEATPTAENLETVIVELVNR